MQSLEVERPLLLRGVTAPQRVRRTVFAILCIISILLLYVIDGTVLNGLIFGSDSPKSSGRPLDAQLDDVLAQNGLRIQRDARDGFTKPLTDRFQYEILDLGSEISALLIKTPSNAYPAGVSVAVDYLGAASDPYPDGEGLSHFVEHLLFLGSQYYSYHSGATPSAPASSFVSRVITQGGQPNGLTAFDWTMYPTLMPSFSGLEDVMRRVADYIFAPKFDENATAREVNAVTSEYYLSLAEGGERTFGNMLHVLADPQHAMSHFGVGSNHSLYGKNGASSEELVRKAKKHHSDHYKPSRMHVVVQVDEEHAEKTARAVKDIFSVANDSHRRLLFAKDKRVLSQEVPLFNATSAGRIYYITNQESHVKQMSVMFEVQGLSRQGALFLQLLTNTLSPCESLRAQQYALECAVVVDYGGQVTGAPPLATDEYKKYTLVMAEFTLSQGGFERADLIVRFVQAYFEGLARALLVEESVSRALFRLVRLQARTVFNYQQDTDAFSALIERSLLFQRRSRSAQTDFLYSLYDLDAQREALILENVATGLYNSALPRNMVVVVRANRDEAVPLTPLYYDILHYQENVIGGSSGQSHNVFPDEKASKMYALRYVQAQLGTQAIWLNTDYDYEVLLASMNFNTFVAQATASVDKKYDERKTLRDDDKNDAKAWYLSETVEGVHRVYHAPDSSYGAPFEYVKIHLEGQQCDDKEVYDFALASALQYLGGGPQFAQQDDFGVQLTLSCLHLNCGQTLYQIGQVFGTILRGDFDEQLRSVEGNREDAQSVLHTRAQIKEYFKAVLEKEREESVISMILHEARAFMRAQKLRRGDLYDAVLNADIFSDSFQTTRFQEYLKTLRVTMLVAGDATSERAQALLHYTLKTWNVPLRGANATNGTQTVRVLDVPAYTILRYYNVHYDSRNEATGNLYAITRETARALAATVPNVQRVLDKLALILSAYAFDYLRTNKQLGYVAGAKYLRVYGVPAFVVYVEGFRFTPFEMEREIENLLFYVQDRLQNVTREEEALLFGGEGQGEEGDGDGQDIPDLQSSSRSEAQGKVLGDISLVARAERIWKSIHAKRWQSANSDLFFDDGGDQSDAKVVRHVTRQHVLDAFNTIFGDRSRKISIQVRKRLYAQQIFADADRHSFVRADERFSQAYFGDPQIYVYSAWNGTFDAWSGKQREYIDVGVNDFE